MPGRAVARLTRSPKGDSIIMMALRDRVRVHRDGRPRGPGLGEARPGPVNRASDTVGRRPGTGSAAAAVESRTLAPGPRSRRRAGPPVTVPQRPGRGLPVHSGWHWPRMRWAGDSETRRRPARPGPAAAGPRRRDRDGLRLAWQAGRAASQDSVGPGPLACHRAGSGLGESPARKLRLEPVIWNL